MKKRFNIIAVLILIALATSFIVNSSLAIDDFTAGFKEGLKPQRGEKTSSSTSYWLDIINTEDSEYNFTLTSRNNQEQVTFKPRVILAKTTRPKNESVAILSMITSIMVLATCITFIMSIVYFIKFILAVNRGIVFERRILFYLKMLGWSLILSFVCMTIYSLTDYQMDKELFDIQGYKLLMAQPIPFFWLLGGLTILLIKQFVAMGIKMKEEQDLTI